MSNTLPNRKYFCSIRSYEKDSLFFKYKIEFEHILAR